MKTFTSFLPALLVVVSCTLHAQAWKWAQSLGLPDNSTAIKNIRPYTGTSVLVSGSFAAPTLTLGSQTLNNAGQDDGYVSIVNENGQISWATSFGGSGRDFVVGAAMASFGSFVVAGNFSSLSMSIGNNTLANSGETDVFVAKYNEDKTLAWVQKIGTSNIEEVVGVAFDGTNSVYVAGQVIDKFTLTTIKVFLRKYDPDGAMLWERTGEIQGGGILHATALTVDKYLNVYLAGSLSGTATFSGTELTSDLDYSAFIIRYTFTGVVLSSVVQDELEKINDIKAYENHIYACADKVNYNIGWGWPLSDSKIHVLKLGLDLQPVWEKSAGGEQTAQSLDIAKGISVDNEGNAYVTGYFFSDTLEFAGQALPNYHDVNYYYPQVFVLKYDADGQEIWGKSFGGVHSDEGTGIHAFGDDQFYLGGNYESEPIDFGAYQLHNTGTLDSMYVHLRPSRFLRKPMGFLGVFDKNASNIDPEPAFQEVTLFPNPVKDRLTIQLSAPASSPVRVQITTLDGRLVRQSEKTGLEIREELGGLAPGLYYVTLQTERGTFTGKFVKL